MDFEAPGFSRQALSRHEIPNVSPDAQRAAAPHQLRQICSPASRLAPNAHQSGPGSASEREAGGAGALNTVWQAALRFDFSRLRQATMASTFGIWAEHRRNTSGMQAARCSSVPRARLGVDHVRRSSPYLASLETASSLDPRVVRSRVGQHAHPRVALGVMNVTGRSFSGLRMGAPKAPVSCTRTINLKPTTHHPHV